MIKRRKFVLLPGLAGRNIPFFQQKATEIRNKYFRNTYKAKPLPRVKK